MKDFDKRTRHHFGSNSNNVIVSLLSRSWKEKWMHFKRQVSFSFMDAYRSKLTLDETQLAIWDVQLILLTKPNFFLRNFLFLSVNLIDVNFTPAFEFNLILKDCYDN